MAHEIDSKRGEERGEERGESESTVDTSWNKAIEI